MPKKSIGYYDQMREGLEGEGEIAGTVTVGSIVTAMGLLSNTVVRMKPLYPRLNVRLVMQESSGLARSVQSGELDAAIFVDDSPQERKGMRWTPLHGAADGGRKSRRWPRRAAISKLLREQPFLRFDRRTPSGIRIEQTLRKLGLAPQDFLELSSLSAIIDLVRQNVGITIVPHVKNADWANDALLRVLPLPGRPRRG